MKTQLIFLIALFLTIGFQAEAQILKRLKKKAEKTVERKLEQKVEKETEKIADSILNGKNQKEGTPTSKPKSKNKKKAETSEISEKPSSNSKPILWSKYNFVPGDHVIFNDDLVIEESGEFPSRWDLIKGSAENASLDGVQIISIPRRGIITPLMDKKEYLPEVFTIEFDAYYDRNGIGFNSYDIRLWLGDGGYSDNSGNSFQAIKISNDAVSFMSYIRKQYRNLNQNIESQKNHYGWKHIALAFNERSLKIFIDEDRVLNIPNLEMQPKQFSIGTNFHNAAYIGGIKNIRIAEGGKKLYDRVMADGKFTTSGILFDVNKSTIKPESTGILIEVAKMMQKHKDLNFKIVGHTDSDGEDDYNKKLSAERASAVKLALVSLNIDGNRFQTEGKGESEPIAENTTAEGKANNRRVDFIKI